MAWNGKSEQIEETVLGSKYSRVVIRRGPGLVDTITKRITGDTSSSSSGFVTNSSLVASVHLEVESVRRFKMVN